MVFRNKRTPVFNNLSFYLSGSKLENVNSFKYLGCILNFDLDDSLDIFQRLSSFNKSFGFLFRKFYSVNLEILYSLFLSFCSSFYGAELWCFRDGSKCREAFKKMSVSYHCALKKILGVPKFYSNHIVCSVLSALTFKHLINFRITRFAFWLKKCNSVCFYSFKYLLNESPFIEYFNQFWFDTYDVYDVLNNDLHALLSRINFIQDREPCSMFLGL